MIDQTSFLQAYDQYADAIFRHCLFRVYDRELARDLAQETFMKAWQQIARGRTIEQLRPFLYKIATNLIIDHVRRSKPIVSLDSIPEMVLANKEDPTDSLRDRLDAERLLELLPRLKPAYREVILLRFVEDLSVQEIAQVLGERENTTSVKLHRALQKLRNLIPQ